MKRTYNTMKRDNNYVRFIYYVYMRYNLTM